MIRPRYPAGLCCILFACAAAFAQDAPPAPAQTELTGRAAAYYYYSLGHMYAELAAANGNRADLFSKAVDNLKLAQKDDPSATFISEELSGLYIQSGRLRDAVTEAEDALKKNPNDLNSRRVLARIYTHMIGDSRQRIDENMVQRAIEQYKKITDQDPKDADSWLMLGRLQEVAHSSVDAEAAYKKALELDPGNTDAMTGLAMVYSNVGKTQEATDLLKKAADKDPSPRNLTSLAGNYEQMKQYGLAAETLRRALDQAQGNPEIERALAQDLLFSNQTAEALKLYQQFVQEDPKDVQSLLRISKIYLQEHDLVKAREAAEKAKQVDPTDLEVQYNDVSLLEAEGKIPEAITTLNKMLDATASKTYNAADKQNRELLLEKLALLYRSNEQYDPAVQTYRQIAELDPDEGGQAEAQIVNTYIAAKDLPKAEREADAAIKKYPKDRALTGEHASLLAELGKTDQAVAEMRKLLDGKNDRETYLAMAEIYEKAKDFKNMAKSLDSAEKLSQSQDDKEQVYFMRGAMYERLMNYDGAEAEFRKVLALNPNNASALNYLGYMLADRNMRLEEARAMVAKALEIEPNNGAYLDSLGWVYYRMNKLEDAEQNINKALESMATDPTVHDHLGDVYFREGKVREAIGQWQNSLQEWRTGPAGEKDAEEQSKVQKKLDDAKVRLARESGAAPDKSKP